MLTDLLMNHHSLPEYASLQKWKNTESFLPIIRHVLPTNETSLSDTTELLGGTSLFWKLKCIIIDHTVKYYTVK